MNENISVPSTGPPTAAVPAVGCQPPGQPLLGRDESPGPPALPAGGAWPLSPPRSSSLQTPASFLKLPGPRTLTWLVPGY